MLMRLHPAALLAAAPAATVTRSARARDRPGIVWMACTSLLGPFAYHALLTQQIALVGDLGIDQAGAVWLASLVGLFVFVFVFRLSAGWLIEARSELFVMRCAAGSAALAALLLLAVVTLRLDNLLLLYPPLMGVGFGAQAIVFACGLRLLVPGPDFPIVYGTLRLASGAGMALGPVTAAALFDLTGSYRLALMLILLAVFLQYATFRRAVDQTALAARREYR